MELIRNTQDGAKNKYALLAARRIAEMRADGTMDPVLEAAIAKLDAAGLINWGEKGSKDEFFAMMLKDRFTDRGLIGYAKAVVGESSIPPTNDDLFHYGAEIFELAKRSGLNHPNCKTPD